MELMEGGDMEKYIDNFHKRPDLVKARNIGF